MVPSVEGFSHRDAEAGSDFEGRGRDAERAARPLFYMMGAFFVWAGRNGNRAAALPPAGLARSRPVRASFEMPNAPWEMQTATCQAENLPPQEFPRFAHINHPGCPPEDATCLDIHEPLWACSGVRQATPRPVRPA